MASSPDCSQSRTAIIWSTWAGNNVTREPSQRVRGATSSEPVMAMVAHNPQNRPVALFGQRHIEFVGVWIDLKNMCIHAQNRAFQPDQFVPFYTKNRDAHATAY